MNKHIKKSLDDWLNDFYEATGKLSEIIRNLGFAGIGLIWVFKNPDLTGSLLPSELIKPIVFIVFGLISDAMQYAWRSINIYIFYKIKEYEGKKKKYKTNPDDITMPHYIAFGTWVFFIAKIIFIAIAYWFIYKYLIGKY